MGPNLTPQGASPDYPAPSCSDPQPGSRLDTAPLASASGRGAGRGSLCWDPQAGHLQVGSGHIAPLEPGHGEGCLSGPPGWGIEEVMSQAPLAPGGTGGSSVSAPVGSMPSREAASLATGVARFQLSGCPQPHGQCAGTTSLGPVDGWFLNSRTYVPTLARPHCHCAWGAEPSAPLQPLRSPASGGGRCARTPSVHRRGEGTGLD